MNAIIIIFRDLIQNGKDSYFLVNFKSPYWAIGKNVKL